MGSNGYGTHADVPAANAVIFDIASSDEGVDTWNKASGGGPTAEQRRRVRGVALGRKKGNAAPPREEEVAVRQPDDAHEGTTMPAALEVDIDATTLGREGWQEAAAQAVDDATQEFDAEPYAEELRSQRERERADPQGSRGGGQPLQRDYETECCGGCTDSDTESAPARKLMEAAQTQKQKKVADSARLEEQQQEGVGTKQKQNECWATSNNWWWRWRRRRNAGPRQRR